MSLIYPKRRTLSGQGTSTPTAIGTIGAYGASPGNDGNGVKIFNSASNNTIGGMEAGSSNTIVVNSGAGVFVDSGTGNRISRNPFSANGGLGIDLAPAGVTPNDPGVFDSGPNNLQNFPAGLPH